MQREISIFDIMIDKIEPHPQNPRKDLGDLSELVKSIEANGIMQNLTVVPLDNENKRFRCVIGHRRLAAAKKAGLVSVPCSIAWDMDEKEQLATMIAENMQRADLTIPEQAQAVQLMLDLGEDFGSIADRTGLSQSTVRRRAKLAAYNQDALTKACKRGATLFDLEKIEKIEDPETRENVLNVAGTQKFEYELSRALGDQKRKKEFAKMEAILAKFATKTNSYSGIYIANMYNASSIENYGLGSDAGIEAFKKKYPPDAVFTYTGDGPFYVYYTSKNDADERRRREIEDKCCRERVRRIEAKERELHQRRMEFLATTIADGDVVMTDALMDMILEKIEKAKGYWLDAKLKDFEKLVEDMDAAYTLENPMARIAEILYMENGTGLSWKFMNEDEGIDEKHMKTAKLLESLGYVPKQDEIDFYEKKSDCFRKLTKDDLDDDDDLDAEIDPGKEDDDE